VNKKKLDIWILFSIVGLCVFGAFNMYGIRPDLLVNFILFMGAGWIAFFGARFINIELLKHNSKSIFIFFMSLFMINFFFSRGIRGSRRWIDLYIFQFQTSEFFKPFFLIVIAHLLSYEKKFDSQRLIILIPTILIPVVAIFIQPDLDTAILYFTVFTILLYFAGTSTRLVAYGLVAISMLVPFVWTLLKDYQKDRLFGFLNPHLNQQDINYNLTQSIIAAGSGGFFGKGLGLGTQARYQFLPEYQTDFAFASLVEQFGFIGGMCVIILYSILIFRLIKKLFEKKESPFRYLFLIGTISFLSASFFMNIGMNLGLMPVTGIALPFISYGGSSMVSTLLLLGFALSM
jgi:rod shape determining protein RodA